MSARAGAALVACSILAVLGIGIAEFPRALEPTRSDTSGIVLNTLVDRSAGAVPNDWYSAFPTAPVRRIRNTLRMTAPATGRMAISRILPVFPHECYDVSASLEVETGEVAVSVFDEEVTRFLDYRLVSPPGTTRTVHLRFSTAGLRRISLAIAGRFGTRATLGTVHLLRLGKRTPCGAGRPGVSLAAALRAKP